MALIRQGRLLGHRLRQQVAHAERTMALRVVVYVPSRLIIPPYSQR
jgi:hypothetical protein